jgi:hypothetical protein
MDTKSAVGIVRRMMRSHIIQVLLVFVASTVAFVRSSTSALSQEKPTLPSRAEVLKGIEDFAKTPLSVEGRAAAAMIVTFADKSDAVTVVVSPSVVPWIHSAKPPKVSETLLAAYFAGNVKSQLQGQRNANDSYAGVQQVLKTYAQLKEADKTLDIPDIQKFVELEAKKQLKKYVDDALKKDEERQERARKVMGPNKRVAGHEPILRFWAINDIARIPRIGSSPLSSCALKTRMAR